jgi:hypothetical protein
MLSKNLAASSVQRAPFLSKAPTNTGNLASRCQYFTERNIANLMHTFTLHATCAITLLGLDCAAFRHRRNPLPLAFQRLFPQSHLVVTCRHSQDVASEGPTNPPQWGRKFKFSLLPVFDKQKNKTKVRHLRSCGTLQINLPCVSCIHTHHTHTPYTHTYHFLVLWFCSNMHTVLSSEQLAIKFVGSPLLGAQATSLTQSA